MVVLNVHKKPYKCFHHHGQLSAIYILILQQSSPIVEFKARCHCFEVGISALNTSLPHSHDDENEQLILKSKSMFCFISISHWNKLAHQNHQLVSSHHDQDLMKSHILGKTLRPDFQNAS